MNKRTRTWMATIVDRKIRLSRVPVSAFYVMATGARVRALLLGDSGMTWYTDSVLSRYVLHDVHDYDRNTALWRGRYAY